MSKRISQREMAKAVMATERLLYLRNMKRLVSEGTLQSAQALTPAQANMVMTVRDKGRVTIKQLTEALHVKAPAASAMVDRLVELGILIRQENLADRREVHVQVSPNQEQEIEAIEKRVLEATVQLLEELGPEHARAWYELSVRIRGVLNGV